MWDRSQKGTMESGGSGGASPVNRIWADERCALSPCGTSNGGGSPAQAPEETWLPLRCWASWGSRGSALRQLHQGLPGFRARTHPKSCSDVEPDAVSLGRGLRFCLSHKLPVPDPGSAGPQGGHVPQPGMSLDLPAAFCGSGEPACRDSLGQDFVYMQVTQ